MANFQRISLTRQQLKQFLPNHEAIKEFERLFLQDTELENVVNNIIISIGLNDDGTFDAYVDTNFIDLAADMREADELLDSAIFDQSRELIVNTDSDTPLSASSQSVLVDATASNINITLPVPANCFSGNRSLRIAVQKIDITANTVTILPNASELVVGELSQSLVLDGEILNFITDGTNWYLGS